MKTHNQLSTALSALNPDYLSLKNESHTHAGYFEGKESHFKLVIVSDAFANLRLLARHQKIYALVNSLFIKNGGSIHALAIHAYTPEEWACQNNTPQSPNCKGGFFVE